MANGILTPMPNVGDPQQAAADTMQQMQLSQNRMQGLMTPSMPQAAQATQQYLTPQSINQLYGILAQGTQAPQQLGGQYVGAMQQQARNDPMSPQNVMRLFGAINPHDYDPKSIQKFLEYFQQTGQARYDFLEDRKRLSGNEEKILASSYEDMAKAQNMIGRVTNLANRFDQAYRDGSYKQGAYGTLDKWFKSVISGKQSDMDLLKTEYTKLLNEAVVQDLPPGVASDRDIALAREGWPPTNANAAYIASFLRGVQKLQVIKYAGAMHKNNYISINQDMRFMAADWEAKADRYVLDSLRANGLEINNIDPNMTPQEHARMMLQGGITETVGGTGTLTQTGQPGAGYVWKGQRLEDMDADARDQAYDEMIDSMLQ